MNDLVIKTVPVIGIPGAICVVVGLSLGAILISKAMDNGYMAEAEINEAGVRFKFGKCRTF